MWNMMVWPSGGAFFTASSKNQGIATFEAHHIFTSQSLLHHEFFNEGLRGRLTSAAFAHMHNSGMG
jgi:hypothetical protein